MLAAISTASALLTLNSLHASRGATSVDAEGFTVKFAWDRAVDRTVLLYTAIRLSQISAVADRCTSGAGTRSACGSRQAGHILIPYTLPTIKAYAEFWRAPPRPIC